VEADKNRRSPTAGKEMIAITASENDLSALQIGCYYDDLTALQIIRPDLVAVIIRAKQRAARSMSDAGAQRLPTPQDRYRDVLRRS
jgi:hypothetical protein